MRDHTEDPIGLVHNDSHTIRARAQRCDYLRHRIVGAETDDIPLHGLGDAKELHDILRTPLLVDLNSAPAELDRVDGSGGENGARQRRGSNRDHRRKDDFVVPGELEEDQHGGYGCPGCAGEEGRHTNAGVGARIPGFGGDELDNSHSEQAADHRPHDERGPEDSAAAAGADRDDGGRELENEKERKSSTGCVSYERIAECLLTESENAAVDEGESTDESPTQHRHQQRRGPAEGPESVFRQIEQSGEGECDQCSDDPEESVERRLHGRSLQRVVGNGDHRIVTDDRRRRYVRKHGRHENHAEEASREPPENDLNGEEHTGDRRVERAGNAPGGPAGQKQRHVLRAEREDLAGERP